MFALHILKDGISTSYALKDGNRWRIGRHPPCEILVADKRISGEHAEILLENGSLRLRRTKGRMAISLDGQVVDDAELADGSSFDIGETNFTVVRTHEGMNLFDARSMLKGYGTPAPAAPAAAAGGLTEEETHQLASRSSAMIDSPSRLLAQLVSLLHRAEDLESLTRMVLEMACQRLGAQRGLIARFEDADNLVVVGTQGMDAQAPIAELISTSVLKQIVDGRRAVSIGRKSDADSKIMLSKSIAKNRITAIACTPVFDSGGELRHLLYVDNQERESEFSVRDTELLVWLGQTYSLLYENIEMGRRLQMEVAELKRSAVRDAEVIAESPPMVLLLERVRKAAASEANVLILGESGSGKEHIARLIHKQSPREAKPVVARNCAAIPENLFESEMFGHKKGSFSGANTDRSGAFLEADGGTLFLDEIGDLDYALQTKLLRAIQEKKIRPVGSDTEIPVSVRLVTATNKDLREACKEKTFREDLFFRISTVILDVPPLRERPEDIRALARHFMQTLGGGRRTLSPAAEAKLLSYAWPGNVRELLGILEQAIIFSAGTEITPDDLSLPVSEADTIPLGDDSLAEVERRHILQVLQRCHGNKTEAARMLGIARSTLVLKLKAYDGSSAMKRANG
ncbi:MAG: sigma 54-interacting transcriptional regulator [Planctomycetes bacterium]|nr:sigma 54-interacting transcriptional regulator [Planctomycetota bacterium]